MFPPDHRSGMGLWLCLLALLCAGVSATDPFVVTFDVTLATGKKDSFDLEIQPEWAPLGAARFKELVDEEFFTSVRFFRVLPGFMAQFGIHGKPDVSSTWRDRKLTGTHTFLVPSCTCPQW